MSKTIRCQPTTIIRHIILVAFVLLSTTATKTTTTAAKTTNIVPSTTTTTTSPPPSKKNPSSSSSFGTIVVRKITDPLDVFFQTVKESRRHLAAAAVARSVSIFSMYPVDTLKTRIQLGRKVSFDGLYKGVGGSLFGQVPYGVLTFGSYEVYKSFLLERLPEIKPIFVYALSAILGDITGSGWLCPSEVVKQQLQAGMHSSTADAVAGIWKKKGLLGFYEGYAGGLARDVPFRVAQLTSYEVAKSAYLRAKAARRLRRRGSSGDDDDGGTKNERRLELSPIDSAICGAIAGTFSSAITSPLDRIKTLLMTDSATHGGNVLKCAGRIWREEGLKGFARGVVPRVVYIAPSVAIFFIAYEQVQQRLADF